MLGQVASCIGALDGGIHVLAILLLCLFVCVDAEFEWFLFLSVVRRLHLGLKSLWNAFILHLEWWFPIISLRFWN